MRPSDHLLRTFAAVPLPERVLDAGCGTGRHLAALALLGFDAIGVDRDPAALGAARAAAPGTTLVEADAAVLPFPDDHAGWVVAWRLLAGLGAPEAPALLAELRRVLRPGGWAVVAVETEAAPAALTATMEAAGWALAEAPAEEVEPDGVRVVRGIYRRVEAGVSA